MQHLNDKMIHVFFFKPKKPINSNRNPNNKNLQNNFKFKVKSKANKLKKLGEFNPVLA